MGQKCVDAKVFNELFVTFALRIIINDMASNCSERHSGDKLKKKNLIILIEYCSHQPEPASFT